MFKKLAETLQSFIINNTEAEVQQVPQSVDPPVKKPKKQTAKKPVKQKEVNKADTADVKYTPKEIATKKKEPWVDVISFNVNKDNIRHGFYELDWNQYFIDNLRLEGYGFDGDPDEEIVNRWFREICINSALAEGIDLDTTSIGSIDLSKIGKHA